MKLLTALEPRCITDRRAPRLLLLRLDIWIGRWWAEARAEGRLADAGAYFAAMHSLLHLRKGNESCRLCTPWALRRTNRDSF